jgi:hypothetical protein
MGCFDSGSWSSTKTDHRQCDVDIENDISVFTILMTILSVIIVIETIIVCICYNIHKNYSRTVYNESIVKF